MLSQRNIHVALVLAMGVAASFPTGASASPPGENGRLAIGGGTYSGQDLWSILPDGSRLRRLTSTGRRLEGGPSWSPDGSRIVFTASNGDTYGSEIFVMRADGSRLRKLTDNDTLDASPDWSPDGRRIVFVRGRRDRALYVMRRDGSHVRRIDYDGYVSYSSRWSPTGDRIAFVGMDDIFTVRLDGTGERRITRNVTRKPRGADGDTYGTVTGLDWSPDGRSLLVSAHKGEDYSYVYTVSRRGGRMKRIARGQAAVWSPDGRSIAFIRGARWVRAKRLGSHTSRVVTTMKQFASSVAWQAR